MDETSITSKDRGLTPKSRSEEDNDVNIDNKDVHGTDQNSAKDPNQIIIEYLLARVPVFRDLVEVRDRVSRLCPFQLKRKKNAANTKRY